MNDLQNILETHFSHCQIGNLVRRGRVANTYEIQVPEGKRLLRVLRSDKKEDQNSIIQFSNEYLALTQIDHSAFLKVSNWGEMPSGALFYVADYFSLKSIRDIFAGGKQSLVEREHVFKLLLDGVSYMHVKGMIHFGIKPDNVFYDGKSIKILQLGQVRIAQSDLVYPDIMVTDGYTSPLIIEGRASISSRSDAYSIAAVGCFLYKGKDSVDQIEFDNFKYANLIRDGLNEKFDAYELFEKKVEETQKRSLLAVTVIFSIIAIFALLVITLPKNDSRLDNHTSVPQLRRSAREEIGVKSRVFQPAWKAPTKADSKLLEYLWDITDSNVASIDFDDYKFIYTGIANTSKPLSEELRNYQPVFLKRHPWVKIAVEQFNVRLLPNEDLSKGVIQLENYFKTELYSVYPDENRRKYVELMLQSYFIVDYIFSSGSEEDRKSAIKILKTSLLVNNMSFHLVGESTCFIELNAAKSIFWPLLMDHPHAVDLETVTSLQGMFKLFGDKSLLYRFNLWLFSQDLQLINNRQHKQIFRVELYNSLVAMARYKEAIYWLHYSNEGDVEPHFEQPIRKLFTRAYRNNKKALYKKYQSIKNNNQ